MPAPPPESEPAMVMARGTRFVDETLMLLPRVPGRACAMGDAQWSTDEEELVDFVPGQFFQVHVFEEIDAQVPEPMSVQGRFHGIFNVFVALTRRVVRPYGYHVVLLEPCQHRTVGPGERLGTSVACQSRRACTSPSEPEQHPRALARFPGPGDPVKVVCGDGLGGAEVVDALIGSDVEHYAAAKDVFHVVDAQALDAPAAGVLV